MTSRTPLDVGKWQMLTATHDVGVLQLYKDARPIGRREVALDDDRDSVVRIGAVDP